MSKRGHTYKDVKISFESDIEQTRNMKYQAETILEPMPIDLRMFPLKSINPSEAPI